MWQRFGSDPEDAAPAAVLRALHRRGVGTLLRVTTSPSHVALTVAVSGDRCTLVFTTTPDAPPRDAVEDVATALTEAGASGVVVNTSVHRPPLTATVSATCDGDVVTCRSLPTPRRCSARSTAAGAASSGFAPKRPHINSFL